MPVSNTHSQSPHLLILTTPVNPTGISFAQDWSLLEWTGHEDPTNCTFGRRQQVANQLITIFGPFANWETACKGHCVRRKHLQWPLLYRTVLVSSSSWLPPFLNAFPKDLTRFSPSALVTQACPSSSSFLTAFHVNNPLLKSHSQKDLKEKMP